jgi:hypothetical protein
VPITNYGHNNQSIGHQWGVISKNLLLLLDTIKAGILLMKITAGTRGLDFDTVDNRFNYGGNIYKDYDENRPFDRGVKVAQGNKTLFYSGYSRRLSSKPCH